MESASIPAASHQTSNSQEQGQALPAFGQPPAARQPQSSDVTHPSTSATAEGRSTAPAASLPPQQHFAQPAQPQGEPARPPSLTYISYPAAALPASQAPAPRPPAALAAPQLRPAVYPQVPAASVGPAGAGQQMQPVVRANRPLSVTLSQAQPHLTQPPRPRVPSGPSTPLQHHMGSAMAQIPVLPRELPARTSSPAPDNPPPNDPHVFTLTDRKVRVLPAEEDMASYTLCRRWIQNMPYKDASHTPPAGAGPPHPELLKPEAALKAPVQPHRPSLPPLPPVEPSPYDGSPPQVPDLPHQSAYQGEVPVEVLLLHHERHWARLRVLHRQKAAHRLKRYHTRLAALMQPSAQPPAPAPAPAPSAAGPLQTPEAMATDDASPAAPDQQQPPVCAPGAIDAAPPVTADPGAAALPIGTPSEAVGLGPSTHGATLMAQ